MFLPVFANCSLSLSLTLSSPGRVIKWVLCVFLKSVLVAENFRLGPSADCTRERHTHTHTESGFRPTTMRLGEMYVRSCARFFVSSAGISRDHKREEVVCSMRNARAIILPDSCDQVALTRDDHRPEERVFTITRLCYTYYKSFVSFSLLSL